MRKLYAVVLFTFSLPNWGFPQLSWSEKNSLGTNTCELGVADVDKDGNPDILVAGATQRWYAGPDFSESYVLGQSDGGPYAARVADMNQDGWADFVTSNGARNGGPGEIYLYLNPGEAEAVKEEWERITVYTGDVYHQNDMRIADMDGDGRLDIIERTWSSERVVVALQNLNINNWTVRSFDTGETGKPEGISAGDVDGDGENEIVLSGVYWDNPGGWRTGDPIEYLIDPTFVQEEVKSAVGDIDNDGDNDIYMGSAERAYVHLAWYENTGKNEEGGVNFTKHMIKDDFGNCHMVELIDIDQDGDLDLCTGRAFSDSGCLIFYNENGGESWIEQDFDPEGGFYTGVIADLDGDGDLDAVGPRQFYRNGTYYYFNESPVEPNPEDSTFSLKVKVLLEGYWDGNEMRSDLLANDLLPFVQPFSDAPWNYPGNEEVRAFPVNTSDWILVGLWSQAGALLSRKAVLLQKDGTLLNFEGSEDLTFNLPPDSSYFLSIYHPGHLAIRSVRPLTNKAEFDFSQDPNQANGIEQQKMKFGRATMICGDFDQNALINNQDFNLWKQNSAGVNVYQSIDADGNGIINNLDFNLWIGNSSKIGDSGL
ncbi:MAG: VCBS repeat-containing protein [Bacteroidota bacterium]